MTVCIYRYIHSTTLNYLWIHTAISVIHVPGTMQNTHNFAFTHWAPKSVSVDTFTVARTVLFAPQRRDNIPVSDSVDNSYLLLYFALN
jgi:hypothetical protein